MNLLNQHNQIFPRIQFCFRRFSVTSGRNIENLRQEHIEYNKEVQLRIPKIVIDHCPHPSQTEKSEISSDIIVQDIEVIERNVESVNADEGISETEKN